MPRKPVQLNSFFPYHVCARCNNQEWYSLGLNQVYSIYENVTKETIDKYNVNFELFVLMGNHFHALLSTPDENLSSAMRFFMTQSSRIIALKSGRVNHIYGSRYHGTLIETPVHYAIAFKYIARNPLAAGATDKIEKYEWISLNRVRSKMYGLMTKNSNGFAHHIPEVRQQLINWINEDYKIDVSTVIGRSLRKPIFKDLKDNIHRRFYDQSLLLPD